LLHLLESICAQVFLVGFLFLCYNRFPADKGITTMATIEGTNATEFLAGTQEADVIFGKAGDDLIFGDAGDDIIYDGEGLDILYGGPGNDLFIVNDNNLFNNASAFFNPTAPFPIQGGEGYDTVDGTVSSEAIIFAPQIFAFASIEAVIGSDFDDRVNAIGVSFNVTLVGRGGHDTLIGGAGDDTLDGGDGDDLLEGGYGADVITTGAGEDRIVYSTLSHSLLSNFDRITDFAMGLDTIDAPHPVEAAHIVPAGELSALTPEGIEATLTDDVLVSFGAATVTYAGSTFLVLNGETPGFQSDQDGIIDITGFTGDLAALTII
jgi:Ca2+-binding RTX toxin-like protein